MSKTDLRPKSYIDGNVNKARMRLNEAGYYTNPTKISDSANTKHLYLYVYGDKETGNVERRVFMYDYTYGGKRLSFVIGNYPDFTLAMARDKARRANQLLAEGKNPKRIFEEEKIRLIRSNTKFKDIYLKWKVDKFKTIKPNTQKSINTVFNSQILPVLGNKPVGDIVEPADLIPIFDNVDTQNKTQRLISLSIGYVREVLQYACDIGVREVQLIASERYRNYTRNKGKISGHHPAMLNLETLREYMPKIWFKEDGNRPGTRLLLKFIVLAACRGNEGIFLTWDRVSFEGNYVDLILSKTLNTGLDKLRIPMSRQMREVMIEAKELRKDNNDKLCFYNNRKKNGEVYRLHTQSLGYRLRDCGIPHNVQVAHGFRATFETVMYELGWDPSLLALATGHGSRGGNKGAYNRDTFDKKLEERSLLMQHWADLLDEVSNPDIPLEVIKRKHNWAFVYYEHYSKLEQQDQKV